MMKDKKEGQDHRTLGNLNSQNDELPYQEGTPLEEKDTPTIQDSSREIFMAILTERT